MAWDASVVTEIQLDPVPAEGALHVAWSSTAAAGTWYQVYVNYRLAWSGRQTYCELPLPGSEVDIAVGAVLAPEAQTDLSASVGRPDGTGNAVALSWLGGAYLDPSGAGDVAGFRVYGETAPGGGVDLSKPLVDMAAYPGPDLSGAGRGPAGRGRAGQAATSYSWTSKPVGAGTWAFDVRAYDAAGNESLVASVSATVEGPPGPPAPFPDGKRLHYSYDPSTRVVTLSWNAAE